MPLRYGRDSQGRYVKTPGGRKVRYRANSRRSRAAARGRARKRAG